MKRLLALVLALVMTLSLTTMAWGADPPVAQIGNKSYYYFEEAIDAAENGQTIVLLGEVAIRKDIVIDKAVTIDASAAPSYAITVYPNSTLTLKTGVKITSSANEIINVCGSLILDGAIISSTAANKTLIDVYGTMTMTDGVVYSENTSVISVLSGGKLAISGGSVYNTEAGDRAAIAVKESSTLTVSGSGKVSSGTGSAIAALSNSTVNIEGGYVSSGNNYATFATGGAKITVSGGRVTNGIADKPALIAAAGGDVNVAGGTVDGVLAHEDANAKATISGGTINGSVAAADGAAMSITGGIFDTDVSTYLATGYMVAEVGSTGSTYVVGQNVEVDADKYITKGTFTDDVSAYLADGYELKNGEVTVLPAVAKIGSTEYTSLQAAFNAAKNGDTITLIDNIMYKKANAVAVVPAGKTVTLDLNGKTITGTVGRENDTRVDVLVNNGTLTVKNGTITSAGAGGGAAIYNAAGANLTIKDVTVYGAPASGFGGGPYSAIINSGTMTVNGAVVKSYYNAIDTEGTGVTVINDATVEVGRNTETPFPCWALSTYDNADLTVNGGTFANTQTNSDVFYYLVGGYLREDGNKPIVVNGGNFSGGGLQTDDGCEYIITGGTFDRDVTAYVPSGYVVTNQNGVYTVSKNIPYYPTVTPSTPSTPSTDKLVESADTFDGGIALAVAVSVLSVTGSAVLLRKKED